MKDFIKKKLKSLLGFIQNNLRIQNENKSPIDFYFDEASKESYEFFKSDIIKSSNFIKDFGYKIINIHPSLLPKYKGLNTHKRVLKSKEKYSGCTVHLVTPQLDSGKIILQKKTLIDKNETEKSLKTKILRQEHKLYPQSIISVFR